MFRTTLRVWLLLSVAAVLVSTAIVGGQDVSKSRYRVVTFAELSKADKDNEKAEPATLLRAGLNRLGKDGWEAIAKGERGIVFRRDHSWAKWEYRLVKCPESTLNGKSEDDEVLQLVLDGLSSQGWELCFVNADKEPNSQLVFKRSLAVDDKKKAGVPVLPSPELKLPPPSFQFNPDGTVTPTPPNVDKKK
jgi:hypothetical protein